MAGNPNTVAPTQEIQALIAEAQTRNRRRIRAALLVAALIAVLLWETQWPALRAGLSILLAGQVALAIFLSIWNSRVSPIVNADAWFQREKSAMRRAAWIENGPRFLGFLVLAFGFWRSTGNLLVSLALGLLYPAITYWGLARMYSRRSVSRLQSQRQRLG